MSITVTTSTAKIAWRRNPDVPAGQPAPGRLNCPCGHVIENGQFADGSEHPCKCGRTWDSRGWLVSEPAS